MSVVVSALFLLHSLNVHEKRLSEPSVLVCLNKVTLLHAGLKVAVVLTEKLGEEIGVRPS